MARILFTPLGDPDGLDSFDEDDADDPTVLEAGGFVLSALDSRLWWRRLLYIFGRPPRFIEGVQSFGQRHPEHLQRKVPFVERSGRDTAVLCARHGKNPPEAVLAALADLGEAPESDPLTVTFALIGKSVLGRNLVEFLARQPARTATLDDVCKHIYKMKSTTKKTLKNTRLLIKRNARTLEHRTAPLRIAWDRKTPDVRLIDCC